ncbi:uncharacterized protein LOC126379735 [Pectinophora gossypiella]|uniref:uncharacterized protein LOC126379735 n=1 Tax=Pectinophora gossypiella TaxID=13191 RepID=UPI00214DFE93|nr:uncharacterized protein LOC126379735 [Pectinophora gossypiella]
MFKLYLQVLTENDLLDKPDRIFNIDETGVQLNNTPGKVIVTKGTKSVHSITSGEKGETMSIIACCNAAGNFLSPVVIIKGVNKKPEFLDGLPHGSDVYMNKKSAYVNAELFQKWLVQHFVPRKPQGKVILLLDGHSSHTNSVEMLETAEENGIILFCLPSHSTQALQPLDRSFFKPFKTFFAAETKNWMLTNKEKKINRLIAGKLIGNAWIRATTPSNAISGFRACGIYPYNPAAIPENFFAISDLSSSNQLRDEPQDILPENTLQLPGPSCSKQLLPESNCNEVSALAETQTSTLTNVDQTHENCGSHDTARENSPSLISQFDCLQPNEEGTKETPSKFLQECSPVPKIPIPLYKRGKQSAAVLNSKENIANKKIKDMATPNIPCKRSKIKVPRKIAEKRARVASEETDSSATNDCDESFKENESHVDVKQKNVKRAKKLKINKTSSVNEIQRPIRAVQKKQRITKNASEELEEEEQSKPKQYFGSENKPYRNLKQESITWLVSLTKSAGVTLKPNFPARKQNPKISYLFLPIICYILNVS